MSKIRPISGFPELLPAQRLAELHFLDVIRDTFERHGFAPVQTRSVEPVERLLGKGGDTDKEIYGVSRLAARDGDSSGAGDAELGLHFDLTVPLARYVVEHAGHLQFPFRRYQIQQVWRGERPQEGRYREFTQCDIDVVDVDHLAPHHEVEMPLVIAEIFGQLPVGPFRIQVNNRKIPQGFYTGIGLGDIAATLRVVDKLDKIGPEAVLAQLQATGASQEQAHQCLALAQIRTDDGSFAERVRELGVDNPTLEEGLQALSAVMAAGAEHAPGVMVADLSVARGLDYYTGTVYETRLVGHEAFGSVCSGGRYDALASDGRVTYPGVGISIGLTRLLSLLFRHGLTASRSVPSVVLVALAAEEDRPAAMRTAAALRSRGIATEVAASADRFGKQIRYADRRGIPFVWFAGRPRDDGGPAPDQVKDIRSGEQVEADVDTWSPPAADRRPGLVPPDLGG